MGGSSEPRSRSFFIMERQAEEVRHILAAQPETAVRRAL
jgi:hypothetical protein